MYIILNMLGCFFIELIILFLFLNSEGSFLCHSSSLNKYCRFLLKPRKSNIELAQLKHFVSIISSRLSNFAQVEECLYITLPSCSFNPANNPTIQILSRTLCPEVCAKSFWILANSKDNS